MIDYDELSLDFDIYNIYNIYNIYIHPSDGVVCLKQLNIFVSSDHIDPGVTCRSDAANHKRDDETGQPMRVLGECVTCDNW